MGGSETLVETIAQRFPEGAPGGVRVLAYRWADADQAEAYSRR